MTSWLRYVHEDRVPAFEQLGWLVRDISYAGEYCVFVMEHLCCCRPYDKPPEPKEPHAQKATPR